MNVIFLFFAVAMVFWTSLSAQSERLSIELDQNIASLKWDSQLGSVYFLQFSPDLENWSYFPEVIEPGSGLEKEWMFSSVSPKLFTRLRAFPSSSLTPETEDFDSDGFSNFFELRFLVTDPLDQNDPKNDDFDGDGLSDTLEIQYFGNIYTADFSGDYDGDGISNGQELLNGTNPSNNEGGGEGGGPGGGDKFSGVHPIPHNMEHLDHTGEGDEDVKTEDSDTFTFTEGASSFFVLVGVHSVEYDYYTDPACITFDEDGNEIPCDFNDIVTYELDSPTTGDNLTKTQDMNDLDDEWDAEGKDFDIGEGEKFYYFAEQKVIKNEERVSIAMEAKVEATNINDGTLPSGATIAVFPVQIQPKAPESGLDVGDLIMSIDGKVGEKHFVSTKTNPDLEVEFLEFEVTGITEEIFTEFLKWEGGIEGTSPLERKVTRSVSDHVELKIKVKKTDEEVDLMNVWTVWTEFFSASVVPEPTINDFLMGDSITKFGDEIVINYSAFVNITPVAIITRDDHPNLTGKNATPPPGGTTVDGGSLATGASAKWDISRRLAQDYTEVETPRLDLPKVIGRFSKPEDLLIGNDDSKQNDEKVDPYTTNGVIDSEDPVTRVFARQGGDVGDTFENTLDFEEFVRLEINGIWYLISEPDKWKATFKFKKEAMTEMDVFADANFDQDFDDDLFEVDAGANGKDFNGDGDTGDTISRWVDNGSIGENP